VTRRDATRHECRGTRRDALGDGAVVEPRVDEVLHDEARDRLGHAGPRGDPLLHVLGAAPDAAVPDVHVRVHVALHALLPAVERVVVGEAVDEEAARRELAARVDPAHAVRARHEALVVGLVAVDVAVAVLKRQVALLPFGVDSDRLRPHQVLGKVREAAAREHAL
jgi:hypothetical protein